MKSPKREKDMKVHTHKKQPNTLIGCYTPKVLECLESLCEQSPSFRGDDCRVYFCGFLNKNVISAQFHLSPATAWRVINTAWQMWLDWYQSEESFRQKQVLDLAERTGWTRTGGPSPEAVYRDFRRRIRCGREAEVNGISTRFEGSRADFFRQVIDIAKASIESCPWRKTSDKSGSLSTGPDRT